MNPNLPAKELRWKISCIIFDELDEFYVDRGAYNSMFEMGGSMAEEVVDNSTDKILTLIQTSNKEAVVGELQKLALVAGANIEVNDYIENRIAELKKGKDV
jgi:hypothetical protein